jgi:hypothetical protein
MAFWAQGPDGGAARAGFQETRSGGSGRVGRRPVGGVDLAARPTALVENGSEGTVASGPGGPSSSRARDDTGSRDDLLEEVGRRRIARSGCLHCGSDRVTCWGRAHGSPRYRCSERVKRIVDAIERAVPAPQIEIIVDPRMRRQVPRNGPPLRTYIRPSTTARRFTVRLLPPCLADRMSGSTSPLRVRQVTRIA